MQWGTARNLVRNMVQGVSDGFTIGLEINGVAIALRPMPRS